MFGHGTKWSNFTATPSLGRNAIGLHIKMIITSLVMGCKGHAK